MAASVQSCSAPPVVTMGEQELPRVCKRFICSYPDCNATYNKNWKLLAHLCSHTGERPFTCTYEGCDKAFVRSSHLTRHSLTHTGDKPYKCEAENCNMAFSLASNMRLHFKRAHASPAQVYVCYFADCGQQFKKHGKLKIHQYTHTNQLPFKCSHEGCDKSYASPSRLKRHEKVHAGYPCLKDATCPFVGKTWTEYLKHAADVHSEVACVVCKRVFKNKSNLKDHKRIHKEQTDVFQCPRENCDKTYTTKFNLRCHVLSFHDDMRPFVCTYEGCGKSFPMKQSLERHFNTHDPEKKKIVKPPRPKRSLSSRLSGYKPKKSKKKRCRTPAPEDIERLPVASQPDSLLELENMTL